ncbi:MAG: pyridoxal-phosphate dependent enzyme [Flavobacteriales bacterium]|nr:pyridoxal-phosphate dependent enzyme [Flavobacteriales bacterium]MBP6575258.1 pyridoxal-phosphate dependent enzyme [Flavobacteriales bacterium]
MAAIHETMLDLVGNTPMVRFRTDEVPDVRILVKLESFNPTGSIKDRACLYLIRNAIRTGRLVPGKTILDASSGNMACALAYFGRILGYPVHVICNTKLTEDKRGFIRYFGAGLEVFGDITVEGNRKCKELADADDTYCFMDQLHDRSNPQASYETLGPEILKDLPRVSAVAGSMGSGGSMCGLARYMKEHSPATMIITSQAASGTKIPGTGAFVDGDYVTPFIEELRNTPLYDDTFLVEMASAQRYTRLMADQGIFVGFQGGGVMDAAIRAIKNHGTKGDVVVVIGDSGWKNMDKLKALVN